MKKMLLTAALLTLLMPAVSAQNITLFPYTQGFESGMVGWTVVDGDGDGYNWTRMDMSEYEVLLPLGIDLRAYDGHMIMASSSTLTDGTTGLMRPLYPSNWLISPTFYLPSNDTLTLSWYCRIFSAEYSGDRYEVLLSTGGSDTADFTTQLFTETMSHDTYLRRSVNLADYMGQSVRIAFHHYNCSNNSTIMLDHIVITDDNLPQAAMQGPSSVQAGEVATFSVQQVLGATAGLDYEWIAEGADYLSAATGASTVGIRWASAGDYAVSAIVSNIYGADTATMNVHVYDCGLVTTYPFYENFRAGAPCWRTHDADEDGQAWTLSDGYVSSTSESWFAADPQDNWLIAQPMQLGPERYVLRWKVAPGSNRAFAEHYSVLISTDTNVDETSGYTEIYSETLDHYSDFEARHITLDTFSGQPIRIAFRHHDTQRGELLKLTDIEVAAIGAPIIHLTAPSRAIAGDEVCFSLDTLSFSPITDITWTVATDPYGGTHQESASTDYCYRWDRDADEGFYWVRVEATNALGTSHDMAMFHLASCPTVTDLPYAHTFGYDEQCWRIDGWQTSSFTLDHNGASLPAAASFSFDYRGTPLPSGNRIATPYIYINDSAQYELKYLVAEGGATGDRYCVVARHDAGTDTLLAETLANNTAQLRKLSLEEYTGQELQIEFVHLPSDEGYALLVAGLEVRPITAPEVAIDAPATARTTDLVSLRAVVNSAAEVTYDWQIEDATPDRCADSVATVQWISGGTYTIHLTVSNAYGQASDSATISITHCPSALDAPMREDFDLGIGCWTTLDRDGDGYGWQSVMQSPANSPGVDPSPLVHGQDGMISWSLYPLYDMASYLYAGYGLPLNSDNYLCSPAIRLAESSSWWLSYQAASLGEPSYLLDSYEVRLATSEPQTADDYSTVLRPLAAAPGDDFHRIGIDLTPYAGQTIWLAFRHLADGRRALLLDDVEIGTQSVGIDPAAPSAISLYPNPTDGPVGIIADGPARVEVLDLAGRTLLQAENCTQIDLGAYPAGTYLVRVATATAATAVRILKR